MAWIWGCGWENGAGDWKDGARCIAGSRKPVRTEKAAKQALANHQRRARHDYHSGWVRKIHGNVKL